VRPLDIRWPEAAVSCFCKIRQSRQGRCEAPWQVGSQEWQVVRSVSMGTGDRCLEACQCRRRLAASGSRLAHIPCARKTTQLAALGQDGLPSGAWLRSSLAGDA